jgi:stage II sporulation protein D
VTGTCSSTPSFDAPQRRSRGPLRARRRLPILALVVAGALALHGVGAGTAPPADAAAPGAITASGSNFTFRGGGWGHGIGMSQYGARGMADGGATATQILQHYYSGVTVGAGAPDGQTDIRVRIAEAAPKLTLTAGGTTTFEGVGTVGQGAVVVLDRSGNSIRLSGALNATVATLRVRYDSSTNPLTVSPPNHPYRHGSLLVKPAGTGLRAIIEQLPMNQYLLGLHEMPFSWPDAALQAQVIAGRTFALKRRDARRAAGTDHDVTNTVSDQAYSGVLNETPANWYLKWVSAVQQTDGQVIRHGNALIDAVYSSSSGGHTEHSEYVWTTPVPYLRGKPDPYDAAGGSPYASWTRTYSGAELGSWFGLGTVTSVSLLGPFGVSGRVDKATVRLTGTGGAKEMTGNQFRSVVNARSAQDLLSTKFTVVGAGAVSSRPPAGTIRSAAAQGRTIAVSGTASDPDGTPLVRVVSTMGTQRAVREVRPTGGSYNVSWQGSPGTRRVCVSVVDVPTGAEHSLGCRDVVVK